MDKKTDYFEQVTHYHETTKHHLHRYSAGPETLDWDDQPEAFRWFNGADKLNMPLVADRTSTLYKDLYSTKTTPQPLTRDNLACLLEISLGLSAWKQYGDTKWPLRCNPSSGNLHGEEAYVICNTTEDIPAGIHHYFCRDHQLEQRCQFPDNLLPANTLLIGLTSIHWREAWKYGERAFRYCQLDIGHAIAALRYAAAALGWRVNQLECSSLTMATLFGVDQADDFGNAEREDAEILLQISSTTSSAEVNIDALVEACHEQTWHGKANQLSAKHLYDWPIIEQVSLASQTPDIETPTTPVWSFPQAQASHCDLKAATLIRQRRSAQAFDGKTYITAEAFYRILDMTLPRNITPWDCLTQITTINLILFVHRVDGLVPGLYTFVRNPQSLEEFKTTLARKEFEWLHVEGSPAHLPLYQLVSANSQKMAATLSCHQDIAGQSCFSLGMVADCKLLNEAAWHYRRLYWEAGMIGQVLYLEAEAAGIQGTGIGCYFDDAMHQLLNITDNQWQSLYHFTVGKGIFDSRIQTIPAYAHLGKR